MVCQRLTGCGEKRQRPDLRGVVVAFFYSLIESAMLAGVEPRTYRREAARRAIRNPGTVTLPRNLEVAG